MPWARHRSSMASRKASAERAWVRSTAMIASPASMAVAAATTPSSTRCGSWVTSMRSLALARSPSHALATRTRGPLLCATACILVTVGNDGAAATAETRVPDGAQQVPTTPDRSVDGEVLRERQRLVAPAEQEPREPRRAGRPRR